MNSQYFICFWGFFLGSFQTGWAQYLAPTFPDSIHVLSAPDVHCLPLTQINTTNGESDCMVILMSGDGGWRPLVQDISKKLAANGMPVLGINSLKYIRKRKTPEKITADISRLMLYGASEFGKSKVILVGYSCGANFLPFVYNRLSPDLKSRVQYFVFLSPESKADFKFHRYNQLNISSPRAKLVKPELEKMKTKTALFIYGQKEKNDWYTDLITGSFHLKTLPGGHHFNYDSGSIVAAILAVKV